MSSQDKEKIRMRRIYNSTLKLYISILERSTELFILERPHLSKLIEVTPSKNLKEEIIKNDIELYQSGMEVRKIGAMLGY